MDNQQYVAQPQPSCMIYPEAQPEKPKTSKKWILIVALAVVVMIVLATVLLVIYKQPTDNKTSAAETNDSGYYADEFILDDKDLGQAFWDVSFNGETISRTQCKKLIGYGNAFAKRLKKAEASDSVCDNAMIELSTEMIENDIYPYGELKNLYIRTGSACLKFSFYEHLKSLQSYDSASTQCPTAFIKVEVTK